MVLPSISDLIHFQLLIKLCQQIKWTINSTLHFVCWWILSKEIIHFICRCRPCKACNENMYSDESKFLYFWWCGWYCIKFWSWYLFFRRCDRVSRSIMKIKLLFTILEVPKIIFFYLCITLYYHLKCKNN